MTVKSQTWLHKIFNSEYFDAWMCVSYMYKYPDIGIHYYICNKLITHTDLPIVIPQLIHIMFNNSLTDVSYPIYNLLKELAVDHGMAMKIYFLLDGYKEKMNVLKNDLCKKLISYILRTNKILKIEQHGVKRIVKTRHNKTLNCVLEEGRDKKSDSQPDSDESFKFSLENDNESYHFKNTTVSGDNFDKLLKLEHDGRVMLKSDTTGGLGVERTKFLTKEGVESFQEIQKIKIVGTYECRKNEILANKPRFFKRTPTKMMFEKEKMIYTPESMLVTIINAVSWPFSVLSKGLKKYGSNLKITSFKENSKNSYFSRNISFISNLVEIINRLKTLSKNIQQTGLEIECNEIQMSLPDKIILPFDETKYVLGISIKHCKVLSSAASAPYIIVFETAEETVTITRNLSPEIQVAILLLKQLRNTAIEMNDIRENIIEKINTTLGSYQEKERGVYVAVDFFKKRENVHEKVTRVSGDNDSSLDIKCSDSISIKCKDNAVNDFSSQETENTEISNATEISVNNKDNFSDIIEMLETNFEVVETKKLENKATNHIDKNKKCKKKDMKTIKITRDAEISNDSKHDENQSVIFELMETTKEESLCSSKLEIKFIGEEKNHEKLKQEIKDSESNENSGIFEKKETHQKIIDGSLIKNTESEPNSSIDDLKVGNFDFFEANKPEKNNDPDGVYENQNLADQKKSENKNEKISLKYKTAHDEMIENVTENSIFKKLVGYRVIPLIVKTGSNFRKELFAYQLLTEMKNIWNDEGVNAWVSNYRIYVVNDDSGLVEPVSAESIHYIKKKRGGGAPYSLLSFFKNHFEDLHKAKLHFLHSLVGYSVLSYLISLKDRHNGNILIDRDGHMVHVDFGFIFGDHPGFYNVEKAHFKFSVEYSEMLDYNICEFRNLFYDAFYALRKHSERLCLILEIFENNSRIGCINNSSVMAFKEKFKLELKDEDLRKIINGVIDLSVKNITTSFYDSFQYYSNGYL